MEGRQNWIESYDLRRIILFGSAGSCSLIFSVLFLLFLDAQTSSHPGLSTDTISEMMSYAEFFLFAFGSFFAASILVWHYTDFFSRFSVSWLLISIIGSTAFSVSFLFRVWISSVTTYKENDPFQSPPPEFWKVVVSVIVVAGICSLVTSAGSGLISAITRSDNTNSAIPH